MSNFQLLVLCPVLDDWQSLGILLSEMDGSLANLRIETHILAINDGASRAGPELGRMAGRCRHISRVEVLNLNCNLGHQRAIAIGLAYAIQNMQFDAVLIMDSDGEDRPDDIPGLYYAFVSHPDHVAVARRDRRSEGVAFTSGYLAYKLLFRLLTGRAIGFGNFCLMSTDSAARLVHTEFLWNHLPATILRSRLPVVQVSTTRGERYAGQSRMNFTSLMLLGLSAISVFSDTALMRIVCAALILTAVTLGAMATVIFVRFATDLAIPGWASTVFGSLSIIFIQGVFVSVLLLFTLLSNRSQHTVIPARDFAGYVKSVETIHGNDDSKVPG